MSSASSVKGATSDGQAKVAAVLATASRTGCTSTLANLAFVLAGAGRHVLIMDWSSDSIRVRKYLEPFLVGPVSLPERLARSLTVVCATGPVAEGAPLPTATRFAFPEATGQVDVVGPMHEGDNPGSYPQGAIADLRRQLQSAGYDDVLIDAPTGAVNGSPRVIAALCDLAIVCFRPRPQTIDDAAELAGRLRRDAPIRIGLLPVAIGFDDSYRPRTERIRDEIHAAFVHVLAGQGPRHPGSDAVELPYRAYDTFDPLLSLLVEEPSPANRLWAGYAGLVAAVTDDVITAPAPISAAFRARYRRAFGLDSARQPDRILIAASAPDRPWADWIRGRLERSGAHAWPLRRGQAWLAQDPPPRLVVITSEHLDESTELTAVTEALAGTSAGGGSPNVFRVLVGRQPVAATGGASAVLAPGSEQQVIARLLNHFGLIERPATDQRLPGDRPDVFSAPPRNPRFTGRDDDIEELRDRLVESDGGRTMVTLSGAPGVGKSELALEYAYRFAGDYDLVWWIPAGDEQSAMVSLAALASRLDVRGSHDFGTTTALHRLTQDRKYGRFLLIYDNVEDHAGLDGLLPGEHAGHVIITSREGRAAEIELAAMTPKDSALLLTSQVPGLSREDATRVAEATGHLPLALEVAGTLLAETAAGARGTGGSVTDSATWAVRTFSAKLVGSDAGASPSHEGVVARVVAVAADSVCESPIGRVVLLLAQLCSFLSPDGISLDLVRSVAMFDRLLAEGGEDAERLRLDAGEIDRVLWSGVRHGLFQVAWGRENALRLHRVVQAALRCAMTSTERGDRRAAVLTALAAYAPTEVEEPTQPNKDRFAELQRHLVPAGATDSDDDAVRRWLINQVHFLFAQGGHGVRKAALGPAQKLLDSWTSRYGLNDPLRLRLAGELANLYRAVGDHAHAFRLDDSAVTTQRATLELNHPQALLTALGLGGDLRGLGLFAEALDEDQATWEGFREALGEDHPRTRMAAHNLASALFLSGDVPSALALAENNYRQRLRLLGEDDVSTWAQLTQVGMYQRELGAYSTAWSALREAAQRLRRLRPALNTLGAVVQWQQAAVLRCQCRAAAAKQYNSEALGTFRELLGPDHPNTLACQLSFAAAHRALGGEPAIGLELAETVLDGYLSNAHLVEEHPFVALSRIGVGLARCAAGLDGSSETAEAARLLSGKLGDAHPWTLAAAVDHARVVGARGDVARATELARAARDGCVEFLGPNHPYTVTAAHNVRLAVDPDVGTEPWREIDVDVPES